jgi:hypothetical protein
MTRHRYVSPLVIVLLAAGIASSVEDSPAAKRFRQAQEFDHRAQQRTGVLVPLYLYPKEVQTNAAYNRLIELKRQYETVPMWVIVNPASSAGAEVDPNYTKAINRLCGAGCTVLGYVTTSYGKRKEAEVRKDIDQWLKLYPRIQGIFFDEMIYEDTEAGAKYQAALNQYAHDAGCWPTVANPGADTPGRYFAAPAADVIVIHEGDAWPKEERLKGGGYADYPPFTRGVLVYAQPTLDRAALRKLRKFARWVYITDGVSQPGKPQPVIPWDRVSKHLEEICEQLNEK